MRVDFRFKLNNFSLVFVLRTRTMSCYNYDLFCSKICRCPYTFFSQAFFFFALISVDQLFSMSFWRCKNKKKIRIAEWRLENRQQITASYFMSCTQFILKYTDKQCWQCTSLPPCHFYGSKKKRWTGEKTRTEKKKRTEKQYHLNVWARWTRTPQFKYCQSTFFFPFPWIWVDAPAHSFAQGLQQMALLKNTCYRWPTSTKFSPADKKG